jgi:hypothetical protein
MICDLNVVSRQKKTLFTQTVFCDWILIFSHFWRVCKIAKRADFFFFNFSTHKLFHQGHGVLYAGFQLLKTVFLAW